MEDKMVDKTIISVIMSVYNGEKYIREAIESIIKQKFKDFEFIIVNDGSQDNSLEIIKSYNDKRIKIINNEKNIGLTKSLNKALKIASGKYIARQDADDISLASRFEEQVSYLDKHQKVALLGTSIYRIDNNGKMVGKNIATAKPTINDLFKINHFYHGSVMFKKEIVSQLGGYNEQMRYSQDYEFWLRIANSFEVRNLMQLLYKFRYHGDNIRIKNREDATLYHLFALRSIRGKLDEELLKSLKDNGIKSLYPHLNKNERVFFHKEIAGMHVNNSNMKLAREEYKKIFDLNSFDFINCLNFMRSFLGKSVMEKSSKVYGIFMNFSCHLKNLQSR